MTVWNQVDNFDGKISHFSIWDYPLSNEEASNNPHGIDENLICQFNFSKVQEVF